MKILWYVSQLTQSGGGERFTLATAKAIRDNGHDILIVSDIVGESAFFRGTYTRDNVVDLKCSYDAKISFFRKGLQKLIAIKKLYKIVQEFKPDLLLCQSEFDAVRISFIRMLFPKIPFKVFIFGQMFQLPQYITKFSSVFKKHLKKIVDSSPGYSGVISYKTKLRNPFIWLMNEIVSRLQFYSIRSASDVYVLSNQVKWEVGLLYGIESKVLRGGIDDSQINREKVSNPSNIKSPARIVTISRLESKKRIDLLIRGFELSQSDGRLIIIGDGPERANLEKLASSCCKRNSIYFLGRVSDSERIAELSSADCFCYLDVADFGITVVEAMAIGIRCIVTEDFDLKALGKDVSGIVSIKANEKKLSELLSDLPSIERSNKSNLKVLASLTWQHVASEVCRKI